MLKNIKSALKNSVIYGIGSMLPKLIGFILLPMYVVRFPTNDYGYICLLETAQLLFVALFGLAFYQALFRWYCDKKYEDKKKEIFFTSMVFTLFIACIMIGCLAPFATQLSQIFLNNDQNGKLIYFVLISTAFELFVQIITSIIRLQEKPMLFTKSNLFRFTTNLVLTIWFIQYKKMWIEGIYYAQFAGMIVFALYMSKYVWANMKIKFEGQILKEMLQFCYPLAFSSVFAVILSNTDRFAIKSVSNFSDVGLYALGSKLANAVFMLVVSPVNMAIAPMIFKMIDDPNNKRFYSKLMTYFCFGVAIVVLGLCLFSKELIKVFAQKPAYWDAYQYIPLLSFAILMNSLKDTAVIGIQIMKKTKILAVIIGCMAFLTIMLNNLLVPLIGSQGAALSVLITASCYFGTVLYFSQKCYYIPYELAKLAKIISTAIALFLVSTTVNDLHIAIRLIVKSILLLSFPILLYWIKFYEAIEIETIQKIWKKWKQPAAWRTNLNQVKF